MTTPELGAPSSTPRRAETPAITKTTITPAPGTEPPPAEADRPGLLDRIRSRKRQERENELAAPQQPLAEGSKLRLALATMLSALALLTIGGAVLVLLLWQQDRSTGVLTTQLERTWELFDALRIIERWLGFAVLPVATLWIAVATINVRRATGIRRNPIIAAGSLPVGVIGAWLIGRELVAGSNDWIAQASGFVLQAVFLAIPLLALLRIAQTVDARQRPLRVTYIVSLAYLGQLQFLGGLSTIDQTGPADEWGRVGAYLIIGGLIQVLGALSANEAARAIEEGTDNRYQLRSRFGEALIAQAARGSAT